MRRRFNHNARVIQELYGRNFSLESLLNEQEEDEEEKKKNRLVKAYNKWADKRALKKAAANSDALSDLNLDDFEDKGKKVGASEDWLTGTEEALFNDFDKIGDKEVEKAMTATTDNKSPDTKPSQQKKSSGGNSKVEELQKLIGHEPANGKWAGTDKTWKKWVDNNKENFTKPMKDNIELIKSSWKEAASKSEGKYTGNIDGMIKFVKFIKSNEEYAKNEKDPNAPDTSKSKIKFRAITKKEALDSGQLGKSYSSKNLAKSGISLQKIPAGFLAVQGPEVSVSGTGAVRKDLAAFLRDDLRAGNSKFGRDYFKDNGEVDNSVLTNATLYLATKQLQGQNEEGKFVNINDQDYEKVNILIDGFGTENGAICNYTFVMDEDNKIFAVPVQNITSGVLEESRRNFYYTDSRATLYRRRYYGRY